MKYIFRVLTILVNFIQVMSIFCLTSKYIGQENNLLTHENEELHKDNPNIKQALMSQIFIKSAKSLFNHKNIDKEPGKYYNEIRSEDKYIQIGNSNTESSGKNNKDNIAAYFTSVDSSNNMNVDLESIASRYLLALNSTVNRNRLTRYTKRTPVQCVKTGNKQLFCVHGNVIYKLKLPTDSLTQEDIGNLVETVYNEIELKNIITPTTVTSKSHNIKRNCNKNKLKEKKLNSENVSSQQLKLTSFPVFVRAHRKIDNNLLNEFQESISENLNLNIDDKNKVDDRNFDSVYSDDGKTTYCSRWFSKRNANDKHIRLNKRRIVLPLNCLTTTETKKPSINEGKTGKYVSYEPLINYKCTKPTCPCTYVWPQIPQQTTCRPEPIIIKSSKNPTRCPPYHFTTELIDKCDDNIITVSAHNRMVPTQKAPLLSTKHYSNTKLHPYNEHLIRTSDPSIGHNIKIYSKLKTNYSDLSNWRLKAGKVKLHKV